MDDPLKLQLNYSEALAHIKERQANLDERELDLAKRHERLLKLEKAVGDNQEESQAEVARLGREKLSLRSDIAKIQIRIDNENNRLKEQSHVLEAKINELNRQIASLETSYNLNIGRNEDLAKNLRAKEVELGAKRRELDELINYHKEQEKSVQGAMDSYNQELHAASTRLGQITTEIAIETDNLQTLKETAAATSELADKEKTNLETELTSLEEQRDVAKMELDATQTELNGVQGSLVRAQKEYDKTLKDTEDLIKKSLMERKALTESRSLLKRVETDAADERRRLQSDRAIYGKL